MCVVKIIQGGGVAAPIAGQILGEVLPYLEIQKNVTEEDSQVKMPNLIGLSLKEAKEVLDGFEIDVQGNSEGDEGLIYKQIPVEGVSIKNGTKVVVYCE